MTEQVAIKAELKKMTQQEATDSYNEYFRYLTDKRRTYINSCDKFYDAAFGNIYTSEELADMALVGQYPVKLNRPLKYLTAITSMITATKPAFRVYPKGLEDNAVSAVCNKLLDFIYKRSKGLMVFSRAVFHSLAANMAYVSVGQNSRNQTSFWFTPVNDIVVSTDATAPFFEDASAIFTHKWMTKKTVSELYGIKMSEISEQPPDELIMYYSGTDGERSIVESHMYDEDNTLIKIIEATYRVVMKEMVIVPADDPANPNATKEIWNGKTKVQMIKKTLIGYGHAFIEQLPDEITDHHDIPIYCYDTKNTFKLGIMSRLYEYSRLANKFFSIMMLNAQLASNPKVFVFEGQIPENDIETFSNNYAQPGSINILSGTGGKESVPPVIVSGQPISSAWFQLVQSVIVEMEFMAIPNQMMGADTTQTNRVSHVFEQYQMTIESIRMFLNVFEGAVAQIGKVALQYFVAYSKDDIPKILDLDNIKARIAAAEKAGIRYDDNEQKLKEAIETTGSSIALEEKITKYKQDVDYVRAIEYITSGVDFTDLDIEVVKGSYLPSHSILKFFQNLELFKMNAVDNVTLLEQSDLENKEEIINRVSTIKSLTSQTEQLMMQNEKANQEIEALGKKLADAERKLVNATGNFKLEKHVTQQRAKDSAAAKILKMQEAMNRMAATYENKAIQDEYIAKIERAILEYELAARQARGEQITAIGPEQVDIGQLIEGIQQGE